MGTGGAGAKDCTLIPVHPTNCLIGATKNPLVKEFNGLPVALIMIELSA